jgi:hypothetical protein
VLTVVRGGSATCYSTETGYAMRTAAAILGVAGSILGVLGAIVGMAAGFWVFVITCWGAWSYDDWRSGSSVGVWLGLATIGISIAAFAWATYVGERPLAAGVVLLITGTVCSIGLWFTCGFWLVSALAGVLLFVAALLVAISYLFSRLESGKTSERKGRPC